MNCCNWKLKLKVDVELFIFALTLAFEWVLGLYLTRGCNLNALLQIRFIPQLWIICANTKLYQNMVYDYVLDKIISYYSTIFERIQMCMTNSTKYDVEKLITRFCWIVHVKYGIVRGIVNIDNSECVHHKNGQLKFDHFFCNCSYIIRN